MDDYGIKFHEVYRHYKGHFYIPINIAINSETLEPMVVYYNAEDSTQVWVRPYYGNDHDAGWSDTLIINNELVPRFEHLDLSFYNTNEN